MIVIEDRSKTWIQIKIKDCRYVIENSSASCDLVIKCNQLLTAEQEKVRVLRERLNYIAVRSREALEQTKDEV